VVADVALYPDEEELTAAHGVSTDILKSERRFFQTTPEDLLHSVGLNRDSKHNIIVA
jgi:hypothetical protein